MLGTVLSKFKNFNMQITLPYLPKNAIKKSYFQGKLIAIIGKKTLWDQIRLERLYSVKLNKCL